MAPRRPVRPLDKSNISSAYPKELVADFENGDLILVKEDGSQKEIPGSLSIETSGNGNAVTNVEVSEHTVQVTKGATYLTQHPTVNVEADANDSTAPNHGQNFTAISGVDTDINGHVTKVTTKTVTLPTETDVTIKSSGTGNVVTGATVSGHEVTLTKGLTVLTEHPNVPMGTDGTDTAAPAHGASFTTVSEVNKDANGHVTDVVTKTVTLPAETKLSVKSTGDGNGVTSIEVNDHEVTFVKGTNFLTDHPGITTEQDTTSAEQPEAGGFFTAVDNVERDVNGHVVKVNTKTITLPTPEEFNESPVTVKNAGSGNAVTSITASGHEVTVTKGKTFLEEHPDIVMETNTTSTAAPAAGKTFTAIDSITKDDDGHVTKFNTKTITIPEPPAETDVSVSVTGSGNAITSATASGHSVTLTKGATFLTEHPSISKDADASGDSNPGYGGTFDVVDEVSRDANGHVTSISTKTITMPAEQDIPDLTKGTTTGSGNAVTDITVSGHTVTLTKGKTFLEEHPTISSSANTTSEDAPGYGGTFTAIDSITKDANGHVTKINTKTITMPAEQELPEIPDVEVTVTGNGNAVTAASADGHKVTLTKGATFLTAHPSVSMGTNGTDTAESPDHGDGFSVVSSITKDANGHVTKYNTKTITLPAETTLKKGTTTGSGNAVTDVTVSGHTVTLTKGATFLTEHPTISKSTDSTSTDTPDHGDSFTAIDSVTRDANGHVTKVNTKTVTLPSIQTTVTGNAGSASKLQTPFDIAVTGAVTGSASNVDGSSDVTITTTSVDASKISGVIPLANIPQGALERFVPVANDTARLALTTSNVQNGDVVKVEATGLMYFVKDETKLGTEAAFEPFTAGTASSVDWSGITNMPNFAAVATSGSYKDLKDQPTIPTIPDVAVSVTGSGNAITTATASGHTVTLTKGATFLTEHPTVTKNTDSTSTDTPGYGGTFTAIDSVTRDANGHVTKINTKTITMPAEQELPEIPDVEVTVTGNGNAVTAASADGHSITLTKGATFLTEHPTSAITDDTTGTASPAHGKSFTAVESVARDDFGHVKTLKTTTVTLPAETTLEKGTTTGSGNAVTDISVSGHTVTLTKGKTFLEAHPDITMSTDGTATESPAHGKSFTALSEVTKDENGHVTAVTTKTVTLPAETTLEKGTTTGSGNAVTDVTVSGHTVTLTKGKTFLEEHPAIAVTTDGTSTADPGYGGTFTAIDSITKDANGHVTKINTKTVTMPAEQAIPTIPDVEITVSGTGNAITAASATGHTVTLTKGDTFLTEHPTVAKTTDGTSTSNPGYGGTFTAIDSITRDSNGHVTKINTKTVTMPAEQTIPEIPEIPDVEVTVSGTGNGVTGVSSNGHTITVTKGNFATTDQIPDVSKFVTVSDNETEMTDEINVSSLTASDIVDNLTSEAADKPLSANQGKILNDTKLNKSGGTMEGILVAKSNDSYTSKQVRNIILSPNEPTSSDGEDGDIWFVYAE